MLKAVLFDMDGVIIDSEPMHCEADILTLREFGIEVELPYLQKFIGSTNQHMWKTIISDYNIDTTVEMLMNIQKNKKDYLIEKNGYAEIDGVKELVRKLKLSGIKLAVASSSPMFYIKDVINSFGMLDLFDILVSGEEVANPKPAPDVFLKAAELLGVEPTDCLVIEDSYNGVTAAGNANMACIGLINPNSGNQDLSKAAMLVEGFEEVDYKLVNQAYHLHWKLPQLIVETERCLIKQFDDSLIKQICGLYEKDDITKHIVGFVSIKDEQEKLSEYIRWQYSLFSYGIWAVCDKKTGILIGQCGFNVDTVEEQDYLAIQYYISRNYCNKGYATEVCQGILEWARANIEEKIIYAIVNKENEKSVHLLKKLGFSVFNSNNENVIYCMEI